MSDIPSWMVRGQKVIVKKASYEPYTSIIVGVMRDLNGELFVVIEDFHGSPSFAHPTELAPED